jgi:predicted porin
VLQSCFDACTVAQSVFFIQQRWIFVTYGDNAMKKKMIVAAVAGALALPMASAQADEIYGKFHTSFGMIDDDSFDGDSLQVQTNNSNIGWKGEEDLGGGLSAIYKAEFAFNADAGGWGSGRDTYVGFKGDWGSFMVGRMNSPFKNSTGSLDPFGDTVADYNNIMGVGAGAAAGTGTVNTVNGGTTTFTTFTGVGHDTRLSNTLAYASPDINGFTFQGAYMVNDGAIRGGSQAAPSAEVDAISLAGMYTSGPLFLAAGYQSMSESGTNSGAAAATPNFADLEATRIGGSYTWNNTTFGAAWENVDDGSQSATYSADRDAFFFSVSHKAGANTFAASYAMADDYSTAPGVTNVSSAATQLALGAYHTMSARTKVYAIYAQVDADKDAPKGSATHSIYGVGGTSGTNNVDSTTGLLTDGTGSALVVGVQHTFSTM